MGEDQGLISRPASESREGQFDTCTINETANTELVKRYSHVTYVVK